jgi:hypothetical protein
MVWPNFDLDPSFVMMVTKPKILLYAKDDKSLGGKQSQNKTQKKDQTKFENVDVRGKKTPKVHSMK